MSGTLGPIVRLQIQRSPLKVGLKPDRRYVTEPLLPVERLWLTPDGVVGLAGGAALLDVHHRHHPETRADQGRNGISIGFTGHYRAMRGRYGPHMLTGCAGENLVVELDRQVTLEEVASGLAIVSPDGEERCRLGQVAVAHPCRPFSGFAHGHQRVAPDVLQATLQFLDGGMRGFYCGSISGPAVVAVGDLVAIRPA